VKSPAAGAGSALLQKVAIAVLVLLYSIILHKGYVDISALARKNSGQEFWVSLARYLIGNLAGGGKRAESTPGTAGGDEVER
jgi:hypothetical protein